VNADIGVQGQHFINTDSNGKIQHFPELRFTPLSGPVRTDIAVRQLKCVDDYYIALTDDGLIYCFGKGSLLPEPLLQFTQYSALQHKKIIEFYIGSFLALFITGTINLISLML
jgi:alpha-tubulin suppressor-like RCC1 family protein